jgi:glycolate oxidase FAD binding subunit
MTSNQNDLGRSLESIVGAGHVAESSISIGGVTPKLIARAASREEIAACLKVCSQAGASVVPTGQMTWLDCGNPLRQADVVLSLSRLTRIIEYSPPDLTACVEAGLTLSEFTVHTMKHRQWLPIDPPGFASGSIGAMAVCNSSGALRLGFGTPRDYVIGLKLAHADGTESKSGGRVVKNVAGYDMNKLYVGSYGTLAVITEVIVKLRPLPDCNSTMLITSKYRGPLFHLAKRVLASELLPASVVLGRRLSGLPEDALLIRFIESEESAASQIEWVKAAVDDSSTATLLSETNADAAWAEVADPDQRAIQLRISVPLSAVPAEFEKAFLAHLECVATADIGAGIIRVSFDTDERLAVDQIKRLRKSAVSSGGALFIEKAPPEVKSEADAWGDAGATVSLMRTLKETFDPQSLLNPGRFVAGI